MTFFKKISGRSVLMILLVFIAVVSPFMMDSDGYPLRIASMIVLFAAMGQSWNIVGGLANQLSLGHSAFFGLGAYTSTLLFIRYGVSPWGGMLIGGCVAAVAMFLLSIPLFRLKGHYFALATLAFAEVLKIIATHFASLTEGPSGITIPYAEPNFVNFQFESPVTYYFIMLFLLVFISFVFYELSTGTSGLKLRAIRENEQAAEVSGIDTYRTKLKVSMISAFMMALCGTMYAQFTYFFDPESIFSMADISIKVALICIVGGMASVWGPIIGALFIIPLEEIAVSNLSDIAGLAQLVTSIILIVAIIYEPKGAIEFYVRIRSYLNKRKNIASDTVSQS